ncbi:MAG TPA: hypothetical protein VLC95_13095 [Anaerolineae bacterium]|nr:hypothetical protein [Anaerolineae bacterium]
MSQRREAIRIVGTGGSLRSRSYARFAVNVAFPGARAPDNPGGSRR